MKLWLVQWRDTDHGNMQRWYGSKREAGQAIKGLKEEFSPEYGYIVTFEEVPTKKAELLEWLNERFNTDNG
jgi:hypothetical protein